ncbi:MAG: hypothetical protein ACEPO8_00490 [Rhodothermaceae bacterium]
MAKKLSQDASDKIIPIVYQFYVALELCFDLDKDEKVFIESYGDVTLSDGKQIEVKNFADDLTDLDHNLWKTLKNWLLDDFDPSFYKQLILLTTQAFGKNATISDWENMSSIRRLETLQNIASEYAKRNSKSNKTDSLLNYVLDKSRESKLKHILQKFRIVTCSEASEELYNRIVRRYAKNIIQPNRNDYINSLMGYIISPKISGNTRWEITYEDFTSKVEELSSAFASAKYVFPSKYSEADISDQEKEEVEDYIFVQKIKELKDPDILNQSIGDFLNTRKTIIEEFNSNLVDWRYVNEYENELHRTFCSAYNLASLNTTKKNLVKDSKKFYYEVTLASPPPFQRFNDTRKFFRNGIIHELADSKDDVKWKLEAEEDE